MSNISIFSLVPLNLFFLIFSKIFRMESHDHTYSRIQQSRVVRKWVIIRRFGIECPCSNGDDHFSHEVSSVPSSDQDAAGSIDEVMLCDFIDPESSP